MKTYEQAINEAGKYLGFCKLSGCFDEETLTFVSYGQSTTIAWMYDKDEEFTQRKIWWEMEKLTKNDSAIAEWYDEYRDAHVEE